MDDDITAESAHRKVAANMIDRLKDRLPGHTPTQRRALLRQDRQRRAKLALKTMTQGSMMARRPKRPRDPISLRWKRRMNGPAWLCLGDAMRGPTARWCWGQPSNSQAVG
jgi:hypothetical protein